MTAHKPFVCPASMREHVIRVWKGEYDVPVEFDTPPRVLDIGANIGAFAIWAAKRWPGATITCYEPHPENYAMLWRNVGQYGTAVCEFAAVTREAGLVELFEGLHNCGEASTVLIGEQREDTSVRVPSRHPSELPDCDVLKIDTEGLEPEIVLGYFAHKGIPRLILLEAHGHDDRDALYKLIEHAGYRILKDTKTMAERWTLGFEKEQTP